MRVLVLFLGAIIFAACGPASPAYNITPTKSQDTLTYEWANDTATFDVTSSSGIGGASIVRTAGDMPKRVILQLRLKGLESLKLRFDGQEVNVSFPSSGAHTVLQSARLNGGAEMELAPGSEYWMPTEIVSVSETVPLLDGYFRIELPPAFYASDATEFSIEWIDFFR